MSQLSRMMEEGQRRHSGDALEAGEIGLWRALSSRRRPESLNVFSDAADGPDFDHEDRPVRLRFSGFDRERDVRILCSEEPRDGDFLVTLHAPPHGQSQEDLVRRGHHSERAAYRVVDVDPSHRGRYVEVRAVMDRSGLS